MQVEKCWTTGQSLCFLLLPYCQNRQKHLLSKGGKINPLTHYEGQKKGINYELSNVPLWGAKEGANTLRAASESQADKSCSSGKKEREPLSPWGSTLVQKVGQTQLPFDDAVVECRAKRGAQFPTNKRNLFPSF